MTTSNHEPSESDSHSGDRPPSPAAADSLDAASVPPGDEDIATAYHEAGHAVIAVTLGRPVDKVTIQRNSLRLGQCQISKRRGQPVKDALEVQALILLAGLVCEARYVGRYNWGGAQQDLVSLRQLARYRGATEKQVDRLQQRWLDKTEYLIDDAETWAAVQQVATALLEKKSLSGRAVQHIVDNVIGDV